MSMTLNVTQYPDEKGRERSFLTCTYNGRTEKVAEIVCVPTKYSNDTERALAWSIDLLPLEGGSLQRVLAFGSVDHHGQKVIQGRSGIDLGTLETPWFGCVVVEAPR